MDKMNELQQDGQTITKIDQIYGYNETQSVITLEKTYVE